MTEYEYSVGLQTLEMRPGLADVASDQLNLELTRDVGSMVRDAAEGIQTVQGGGWEVISHGITGLDGRLVISLLLRRPKAATAHP
jgi:hypothetical protein